MAPHGIYVNLQVLMFEQRTTDNKRGTRILKDAGLKPESLGGT